MKMSEDISTSAAADPAKFHAHDRINTTPDIQLPDELWLTVLGSICTFQPAVSYTHLTLPTKRIV